MWFCGPRLDMLLNWPYSNNDAYGLLGIAMRLAHGIEYNETGLYTLHWPTINLVPKLDITRGNACKVNVFQEHCIWRKIKKIMLNRGGGSCWKVGAQFKVLPLTWSIFDWFTKFFFLLKACLNYYYLKKWVRNCAPCAPASATPASWYMN